MRILNFIVLIICFSVFSVHSIAQSRTQRLEGNIKIISGEKTQNLAASSPIQWGDTLYSTETDSFIRFTLDTMTFVFKGPFRVKLEAKEKSKRPLLSLFYGAIRALVPEGKSIPLRVRTKGASIGVRGTDFYVSYGKALAETEVICFESSVEFRAVDGKSQAVVKAGQWGGIGGRFGPKINPPLTLPGELLDSVKSSVPLQ